MFPDHLPAIGLPANGVSPRLARSLGYELSTVRARSSLDLARIEAAVASREALTDGVTSITARAMQHTAVVGQAEMSLALAVPQASGRLAALADSHAIAMTGIVMDTARALGRLV